MIKDKKKGLMKTEDNITYSQERAAVPAVCQVLAVLSPFQPFALSSDCQCVSVRGRTSSAVCVPAWCVCVFKGCVE